MIPSGPKLSPIKIGLDLLGPKKLDIRILTLDVI